MTRLETLTHKLIADGLSESERTAWERLVKNEDHARVASDLFEIEGFLQSRSEQAKVSGPLLARLRNRQSARVRAGIMAGVHRKQRPGRPKRKRHWAYFAWAALLLLSLGIGLAIAAARSGRRSMLSATALRAKSEPRQRSIIPKSSRCRSG